MRFSDCAIAVLLLSGCGAAQPAEPVEPSPESPPVAAEAPAPRCDIQFVTDEGSEDITLDEHGRVESVFFNSDRAGTSGTERYERDELGRVVRRVIPDYEGMSEETPEWTHTYEMDGDALVELIDDWEVGLQRRVHRYDENGRRIHWEKFSGDETSPELQVDCQYEEDRLVRWVRRTSGRSFSGEVRRDPSGQIIGLRVGAVERGVTREGDVLVVTEGEYMAEDQIRTEYRGQCEDLLVRDCSFAFAPPAP